MKTLKAFITVLAISTVIAMGTLFMFQLDLTAEEYLAWVIGTLAAVIILFVAFLTFENNKKDNIAFEEAMNRDERVYRSRRRA